MLRLIFGAFITIIIDELNAIYRLSTMQGPALRFSQQSVRNSNLTVRFVRRMKGPVHEREAISSLRSGRQTVNSSTSAPNDSLTRSDLEIAVKRQAWWSLMLGWARSLLLWK